MKESKKYVSFLLVFLIVFNFLSSSILLAKNYNDNSNVYLNFKYIDDEEVEIYDFREDFEKNDGDGVRPMSASTVFVFVAGYLVGKIIDGVFILTTGKTLDQHMVDFIKKVYRNNVYSGNTIKVNYNCGYAHGQPCLLNPKPNIGCGYAPGQPCR